MESTDWQYVLIHVVYKCSNFNYIHVGKTLDYMHFTSLRFVQLKVIVCSCTKHEFADVQGIKCKAIYNAGVRR